MLNNIQNFIILFSLYGQCFGMIAVPGNVTSLEATPTPSQSESLTVSWEAPHPPCATEYVVEYQLINFDQCDDTSGPKIMVDTIEDTSITITELHPYSKYAVFVTAKNHLGGSETTVLATTSEAGRQTGFLLLIQ